MPAPALLSDARHDLALDGDVVVRLLVAAVLGGSSGSSARRATSRPDCAPTSPLALGAALFGVISTLGFLEFDRPRAESILQVDVTRVASNVAVGIGFLGAGVIFRQRSNIKNLTTAASLWAVAAIGLACGVGDPTTAAVGHRRAAGEPGGAAPGAHVHPPTLGAPRSVTVTVHLAEGTDPAAVVVALRTDDIERAGDGCARSTARVLLSGEVDGLAASPAQLDDGARRSAGVETLDEDWTSRGRHGPPT